jgi:hypothetical protein
MPIPQASQPTKCAATVLVSLQKRTAAGLRVRSVCCQVPNLEPASFTDQRRVRRASVRSKTLYGRRGCDREFRAPFRRDPRPPVIRIGTIRRLVQALARSLLACTLELSIEGDGCSNS